MTGFVMVVHSIVCLLLVVVILMQSGRGGGLTEGFQSAESMFGTQTNEFMIRLTTIFCIGFFVTCLGLAVLSTNANKSLMASQTVTAPVKKVQQDLPVTVTDTPVGPIVEEEKKVQQQQQK